MDGRHFQIFINDLIKKTDFTFGSPDARERVYAKITAALSQSEEELSDDDLSAAAGGLREFPANSADAGK